MHVSKNYWKTLLSRKFRNAIELWCHIVFIISLITFSLALIARTINLWRVRRQNRIHLWSDETHELFACHLSSWYTGCIGHLSRPCRREITRCIHIRVESDVMHRAEWPASREYLSSHWITSGFPTVTLHLCWFSAASPVPAIERVRISSRKISAKISRSVNVCVCITCVSAEIHTSLSKRVQKNGT